MAESNEQRLRRGYEAVNSGDYEVIRELLDPGILLHDRPEAPDARSYRGFDGMLDTLGDTSETFENFRLDPTAFFEHGEKIVAILTMTGRGRTSGVPVEERIAHLWTIRDGVATEVQAYTDPADALEAAGLPRDLAGE